MSVKGFFSKLGGTVEKAFAWLASPAAQAVIAIGEAAVEDLFPAATGLINIINKWVTEAIKTETLAVAAAAGDNSGAQKASILLATITPEVLSFAKQNGLPTPTAAILASVNDDVIAIINKLTVGEAALTPALAPAVPAAA